MLCYYVSIPLLNDSYKSCHVESCAAAWFFSCPAWHWLTVLRSSAWRCHAQCCLQLVGMIHETISGLLIGQLSHLSPSHWLKLPRAGKSGRSAEDCASWLFQDIWLVKYHETFSPIGWYDYIFKSFLPRTEWVHVLSHVLSSVTMVRAADFWLDLPDEIGAKWQKL